jgi:hypothetical protein
MKTLKISKFVSFVIIFLGLFLTVGSGQSSCEEFFPVADTSVSSDKPDTNYGAHTTLRVDGTPEQITYLRFNITGLSEVVRSARLRLKCVNSSSFGGNILCVGQH